MNTDEHRSNQAKKYLEGDVYPCRELGEERVLNKVQPERVSSMG